MLEDKVMKIPDKNKSTRQPADNVHFIKKINGHRIKNEQTEFLIIWLNFPHSESTYEPEESIFHKQNIKSFFEEESQKRTQYIKNVSNAVQFCQQNCQQQDQSLKIFQGWSMLNKFPLL